MTSPIDEMAVFMKILTKLSPSNFKLILIICCMCVIPSLSLKKNSMIFVYGLITWCFSLIILLNQNLFSLQTCTNFKIWKIKLYCLVWDSHSIKNHIYILYLLQNNLKGKIPQQYNILATCNVTSYAKLFKKIIQMIHV